MNRQALWVALVLASGACEHDLLDLTDASQVATVQVRWRAAEVAGEDFAVRAHTVQVELLAADDQQVLATAELSPDAGTATMDGVSPDTQLQLVVTAQRLGGGTIYRHACAVEALSAGEQRAVDVVLNGLPAVQIGQTLGSAGDIVVLFDLQDPEQDRCDLVLEYAGDRHGPFFGSAAVEPTDVTAVEPGRSLSVVWHSAAPTDEEGSTATVRLRITPADAVVGFASESAPFLVNNGAPAPPSLLINGGDDLTRDLTVQVIITGEGLSCAGISEDPDFGVKTAVALRGTSTFPYSLTAGDGQRTLYARVYSPVLPQGRGDVSDTIIVDTAAQQDVGAALLTGLVTTNNPRPAPSRGVEHTVGLIADRR